MPSPTIITTNNFYDNTGRTEQHQHNNTRTMDHTEIAAGSFRPNARTPYALRPTPTALKTELQTARVKRYGEIFGGRGRSSHPHSNELSGRFHVWSTRGTSGTSNGGAHLATATFCLSHNPESPKGPPTAVPPPSSRRGCRGGSGPRAPLRTAKICCRRPPHLRSPRRSCDGDKRGVGRRGLPPAARPSKTKWLIHPSPVRS